MAPMCRNLLKLSEQPNNLTSCQGFLPICFPSVMKLDSTYTSCSYCAPKILQVFQKLLYRFPFTPNLSANLEPSNRFHQVSLNKENYLIANYLTVASSIIFLVLHAPLRSLLIYYS